MDSFGYVIFTAILSQFFLIYLLINVSRARKKYNIPLPHQYTTDPDKNIFNCYQRAYLNTVENYTSFMVLLFLGGQVFPVVCSLAGLLWILGRLLYAWGYYTGKPAKRANGWPAYIGLLILLSCSIANGLDRLGIIDI